MKFYIISLFPNLFHSFLEEGVISRAYKNKVFSVDLVNPRDFCEASYKSVDDRAYGGGDGMVMSYLPLERALKSIPGFETNREDFHVVNLSPQGKLWQDAMARGLAKSENKKKWIFLCGRYAGIDQRLIYRYVDEEISIGDFVLSGGEYPAMILMDSILRHIPGVLGNDVSADKDSFEGSLLEGPIYTRPAEVNQMKVPSVLQEGHHKNILAWRRSVSILKTASCRPDLLKKSTLTKTDLKLASQLWEGMDEIQKREYGLSLGDSPLSILTQFCAHDSK